MNIKKLIKRLKENGYLEIEIDSTKLIYICEIKGEYHSELDFWNKKTQSWELLQKFKVSKDPEKLINNIAEIYNF